MRDLRAAPATPTRDLRAWDLGVDGLDQRVRVRWSGYELVDSVRFFVGFAPHLLAIAEAV